MVLSSYFYCSPYIILLNPVNNKLINNFLKTFIKNNGFLTFTFRTLSYNLFLSLIFTFILDFVFASNNYISRYTNKNLQKIIKFVLEFFFKAKNIIKLTLQRLRLQHNLNLTNNLSKINFPSYILIIHIQIATTFVRNVKITLKQSGLQALIKFFLLNWFYIKRYHNNSYSTNVNY